MKNINKYYNAPTKQWTYIRPLRTLLYKIIDEGGDDYQDTIIYNLLVYLADKKPVNEKSYIDMMPISKEECFSLASGHQYNINNLAHWVREKKSFISPHDNLIMFPKDIERFKNACSDKGIEWVKPHRKIGRNDLLLTSAELERYRISVFTIQHQAALRELMTGNDDLDRVQALQELTELQPYQAISLGNLYQYGLRGEHFRESWGEAPFTGYHGEQLGSYMLIEHYSPADAMIEIHRQDRAVRHSRVQRPRFFEPMPLRQVVRDITVNSGLEPPIVQEVARSDNNKSNSCSFFTGCITVSSLAVAAVVTLNYI